MRAAAFLAATIVAIGVYLAIAAVLAFSPALIGVGALVIGFIGAVAVMVPASGASARAS